MGTGECRTASLEADGTSQTELTAAGIDATHPLTGYLLRTAEVLWWNVSGSAFQGVGQVNFTSDEGVGRFDIVANTDHTVRIQNVLSSTPSPNTLLHVRSFKLKVSVRRDAFLT